MALKTQVSVVVCHMGFLYCPKALMCFPPAGRDRLFSVQRKVGLLSPLGNAEKMSRCIRPTGPLPLRACVVGRSWSSGLFLADGSMNVQLQAGLTYVP